LKKILNSYFSRYYIEIITSTYALNFFIPNLILILFSLSGNYELISEISIVIGINIIFTQIFSANARSLIISKKLSISLENFLLFRICFSILFLILNIIILNYFNFFYFEILLQISFLIILQWLNELIITFFEINNKKQKIYSYLMVKIVFLILILKNIFLIENFFFILLIFNFFLFFFILFYSYKIINKTKLRPNISKILILSLSSFSFFSSLSVSLANLIWRLLIIFFCGKIIAGVFFVGFAIGSLPGTFFNNVLGPTMLNRNLVLKNYVLVSFVSLLLFQVFLSFYLLNDSSNLFDDLKYTQVFCTFLSLFGTFFMVRGLYYRQYILQKTKYEKSIFKVDIFYSFLVILIIPTLYFLLDYRLLISAFLVSSVMSYIIYKLNFDKFIKL